LATALGTGGYDGHEQRISQQQLGGKLPGFLSFQPRFAI
jgi:hypothetical protein